MFTAATNDEHDLDGPSRTPILQYNVRYTLSESIFKYLKRFIVVRTKRPKRNRSDSVTNDDG